MTTNQRRQSCQDPKATRKARLEAEVLEDCELIDGRTGYEVTADVSSVPRPLWDKQRRELRVGYGVVKAFLRTAPSQELILDAFEEEHWQVRIDNPLGGPRRKAHEHLRDAIKKLNRHQDLIRFHADGTGEGVRWEILNDRTHIAPSQCVDNAPL